MTKFLTQTPDTPLSEKEITLNQTALGKFLIEVMAVRKGVPTESNESTTFVRFRTLCDLAKIYDDDKGMVDEFIQFRDEYADFKKWKADCRMKQKLRMESNVHGTKTGSGSDSSLKDSDFMPRIQTRRGTIQSQSAPPAQSAQSTALSGRPTPPVRPLPPPPPAQSQSMDPFKRNWQQNNNRSTHTYSNVSNFMDNFMNQTTTGTAPNDSSDLDNESEPQDYDNLDTDLYDEMMARASIGAETQSIIVMTTNCERHFNLAIQLSSDDEMEDDSSNSAQTDESLISDTGFVDIPLDAPANVRIDDSVNIPANSPADTQ